MANSKIGKNKQNTQTDKSKHGYYQYEDGYSYWGISLYRKQEIPKEITREEYLKNHKKETTETPETTETTT